MRNYSEPFRFRQLQQNLCTYMCARLHHMYLHKPQLLQNPKNRRFNRNKHRVHVIVKMGWAQWLKITIILLYITRYYTITQLIDNVSSETSVTEPRPKRKSKETLNISVHIYIVYGIYKDRFRFNWWSFWRNWLCFRVTTTTYDAYCINYYNIMIYIHFML